MNKNEDLLRNRLDHDSNSACILNFRRDLTLHSAKLEIKRIFRESFRLTASRVARDKPWSTLCKKSQGIPSSPRAAAVAKFRLLTRHDCLCAHLFRFNLVTSPICFLCDTGQDMTAPHLDECSALNDLNCIVKRTQDFIHTPPPSVRVGRYLSHCSCKEEMISHTEEILQLMNRSDSEHSNHLNDDYVGSKAYE
ncbi:uncharacterized protein TNCV_4119151 [Trichonephila clavipes]|nr:uncharacterized protein TNCV_4119151 [Trichonephila clavipes]